MSIKIPVTRYPQIINIRG